MPDLEILFEDKHVMVVNKPSGILTVANRPGATALLDLARAHIVSKQAEGRKGYLVPVHFLDYPVSGAVMFAVSSKAAARLAEQFRERRITKVYHAAVTGSVANDDEVHCEDYLFKDEDGGKVRVCSPETPGGKHCILDFRAVERHQSYTVVEVYPRTGRSHQIRVQLSSRGLPIVGDSLYGSRVEFKAGIALHAARIELEHPVSKERIVVSAPKPQSWGALAKI